MRYVTALLLVCLSVAIAARGMSSERVSLLLAAAVCVAVALCVSWVRARSAMLVVTSVLMTLCAYEGVTDLIAMRPKPPAPPGPRWAPESEYPAKYYDSTDLGSQAVKAGRYRSRRLAGDGSVMYDVTFTVGDDRFRITPQLEQAFTSRTNFFGCSFMYGEGLADNETMPYFYALKMPQSKVKNFGGQGFGVHQALAILESGRDTSGDVNILVTAPWHAVRMRCILHESAPGNPVYVLDERGDVVRKGSCREFENNPPPPEPPPPPATRFTRMRDRSSLGSMVHKAFFSENPKQDADIDVYLRMIKAMARISAERRQRLVVGFIRAETAWFSGQWSNERILQQLRAWGIDVVDVTLARRVESLADRYNLHEEDNHPSAAANQARAELLWKHVTENAGTANR